MENNHNCVIIVHPSQLAYPEIQEMVKNGQAIVSQPVNDAFEELTKDHWEGR